MKIKLLFVSFVIIMCFGCNQKNDGPPSAYLTSAMIKQDLKEVKKIIRKDPDIVNVRMRYGNIEGTPLLMAITSSNSDIIEYLIEKGADVNYKDLNGASVSQITISGRNYQAFEILLENDVDLSTTDNNGANIYHYVLSGNSSEILNILYKRVPGLLDKSNNQGATPLSIVLSEKEKQDSAIWLLSHGANLEKAVEAFPGIIESMVENKCNKSIEYILSNDYGLVEYNGNPKKYGLSHLSVGYENIDLLNFLLENGYYRNEKDSDGLTPRDLAKNFELDEYVSLIDSYK